MAVQIELPLSDADDARSLLYIGGAEGREGERRRRRGFRSGRSFESLFQLFELGGQDAVLEVHRRGRVLHGAIVDGDELLNVLGDGGAGVALNWAATAGRVSAQARRLARLTLAPDIRSRIRCG